jgi:hypothetical protein
MTSEDGTLLHSIYLAQLKAFLAAHKIMKEDKVFPSTRFIVKRIPFHGVVPALIMKPEETLIIYRDMTCKTEYCSKNPTYDVYESFDANQNCRVRILSDCTLSDM